MEESRALRFRIGMLVSVLCLGAVSCGGGGGGGSGGSSAATSIGADSNFDRDSGNRPPTITGEPPAKVTAGMGYLFRPASIDPDGDRLRFSITNKPRWAQFNKNTGRLQGRPKLRDVGGYHNIKIGVTDGVGTTQLAAFTIEVLATATGGFTVSWNPPLTNTNGSALRDLAGYRIYLGRQPGGYADVVEIGNPGLTTYVFDQLAPGTYYVAISAINRKGIESPLSRELRTGV